jgi:hypothetical protein
MLAKRHALLRLAQLACLSLFLGLCWTPLALADTFGGRAYSAYVNTPSLGAGPLYLADTGELPPLGGWEGAGRLLVEVPVTINSGTGLPGVTAPTAQSVLSATVLRSVTSATDGQANSSSSLGEVVVLAGHPAQLTATFVEAEAEATDLGAQGSTEIFDLIFGGLPVQVSGFPNQRVELPGIAMLVINEQAVQIDGTSQTITVNALHLTLASGEEIILASAQSHVNSVGTLLLAPAIPRTAAMGQVVLTRLAQPKSCRTTATLIENMTRLWRPAGPQPSPFLRYVHDRDEQECLDLITGGGSFGPPNSTRPGKVSFGFNAGLRNDDDDEDRDDDDRDDGNATVKGHLNLEDRSTSPKTKIKGKVDTYFAHSDDPDHCRIFGGQAEVNGVKGFRYQALVCDYGEPSRNDRFRIEVSDGYSSDNFDGTPFPEGGALDQGKIRLFHRPNACPLPTPPDATAPSPPSTPDLAAASDSGVSNTDNLTNDTTPTFTGTAEAGSTVKIFSDGMQVGNGPATGGSYSITTSSLSDGTHSITATATDAAENVSAPSDALNVTIDTELPTVTIDQAAGQADPTNQLPIHFTAVFSEPVTDFTSADVVITAGETPTVVVTDTGDRRTFDVAVSGITDGTVIATIPAGVATDDAGNANTASTSLDNTVSFETTAPTGNLTVTAATTGSDIPAGYTLSTSGPGGSASQPIGANETVTFPGIASGDYTVELLEVAANCTVSGANPRTVTVPADGTGSTTFSVSCAAAPPP